MFEIFQKLIGNCGIGDEQRAFVERARAKFQVHSIVYIFIRSVCVLNSILIAKEKQFRCSSFFGIEREFLVL